MSFLKFIKTAAPDTPASNKSVIYVDTNDRRAKLKDDNGVISTLVNDGLKNRNILTNGGFMIQQKVAVASTAIAGISTSTRAGQVADRWCVTASVASNLNWQQVDTNAANEVAVGLSSRYYGSIIAATAVKKVMISQFIINQDMAHLRGKKVRCSVKLNQKVGNADQVYKLGLLQLAAAGTTDTSPTFLSGAWSTSTGVDPAWSANITPITPDAAPTGENGTITGSFLNITLPANIWQRSSCVFTIPYDAKNLYFVLFANASSAGTTDNLSVAEFQMTEGPEIVDFVQPPFIEELLRCQRFYCKTFAYSQAPAQNIGVNKGEATSTACIAGATALAGIIPWRFPVPLWKTPVTVTLYNPAAANAVMRMTARAADMGTTANVANLDSSVVVTATGVAATAVGDQIGIHITADAEVVN
jgi:hypothetical protein